MHTGKGLGTKGVNGADHRAARRSLGDVIDASTAETAIQETEGDDASGASQDRITVVKKNGAPFLLFQLEEQNGRSTAAGEPGIHAEEPEQF
jgi:hypothetical protein